MSLTYNTFTASLANFLVVPVNDANFVSAIPNIIDDAEQLSYRDLDLLNTIVRDSTGGVAAGGRNFAIPTTLGTFIVVQDLNVITPSGTTDPEQGTRNPLLPVTKEVLDFLYPNVTGSGIPQYFAPITQSSYIVGPWPNANFRIEVVGTQRPTPLSSSNQTTLLSTFLPDVFLNAALVMGYGYLKDFGAMADDPKSGMSWQAKYDRALASAQKEEFRKKFEAQGWSSQSTGPEATPPRT